MERRKDEMRTDVDETREENFVKRLLPASGLCLSFTSSSFFYSSSVCLHVLNCLSSHSSTFPSSHHMKYPKGQGRVMEERGSEREEEETDRTHETVEKKYEEKGGERQTKEAKNRTSLN